jgi:hypothetical protein
MIARIFLSGIQFQYAQVEAFKQLFSLREILAKDLERAEREKLKAYDERERVRNLPQSSSRMSISLFQPKNMQEMVRNK